MKPDESCGNEGQAQGPRPSTHPPPVPTDQKMHPLPDLIVNNHQNPGGISRWRYIVSIIKAFRLSSVKKTSRLPRLSAVAATPKRAEPLPDCASTGTLSSWRTPTALPLVRLSSTRLL